MRPMALRSWGAARRSLQRRLLPSKAWAAVPRPLRLGDTAAQCRFANTSSICRSVLAGARQPGFLLEDYRMGKELGQGSFGFLNLATHRASGVTRVVKTIMKEDHDNIALIQKEIDILARLDHPCIVEIFGYYEDLTTFNIIMDVCEGGDLARIVEEHCYADKPLPESWVARVFRQTLEALQFCHSHGIIHRDLKLANVMLRSEVTGESPLSEVFAALIDFGLADLHDPIEQKRFDDVVGSLIYVAPEVLAKDYTYKADIWSVGCMLHAALNCRNVTMADERGSYLAIFPFNPEPRRAKQHLQELHQAGPDFDKLSCSAAAKEVLRQMLQLDPNTRPEARELLQLPFFDQSSHHTGAPVLAPAQVGALLQDTHADAELGDFCRATLLMGAVSLPFSDLRHFAEIFDGMDSDASGHIDKEDMRRELLRHGLTVEDADRALERADLNKTGALEWSQFVAAMLPASEQLFMKALNMAFYRLDQDEDGQLEVGDIAAVLRADGRDTGMAERILEGLGGHRTGHVSFDEFHAYFASVCAVGKSRDVQEVGTPATPPTDEVPRVPPVRPSSSSPRINT